MPPRILFVSSSRIGDAVLSSGVLAHLVETRPDARFTIACGPVAASLFAGVPRLDRVIVLHKGRLAAHWRRLWLETVGTRWDTVVDLRRSALVWVLRARHRFRHGPERGEHRVVANAAMLGLDPPPAPRLWTLPEHDARAAALIPDGAPVLAVGPSANWIGKTWPVERFIELVRRLTTPGAPFADARVAVFAAPGEVEKTRPLLASLPQGRALAVTAEPDLLCVYAALRRCAFYVGNDSGLMHLAVAAGVPALGMFGPSLETLYAPWGERAAFVRTPESYDTLFTRPDRDYEVSWMAGLSVDTVEAAACDLWRRIS